MQFCKVLSQYVFLQVLSYFHNNNNNNIIIINGSKVLCWVLAALHFLNPIQNL
jgi:hypothetical protein